MTHLGDAYVIVTLTSELIRWRINQSVLLRYFELLMILTFLTNKQLKKSLFKFKICFLTTCHSHSK